MPITEALIDQAHAELRGKLGGRKSDYFGLLYLESELAVPRAESLVQVAFGGSGLGIDAFHFDPRRRNLYLLTFIASAEPGGFRDPLKELTDSGVGLVFGQDRAPANAHRLLHQLKSCLIENERLVDKVLFHFVFLGDPQTAEKSEVLSKLREDLENKKFLIDKYFGRAVGLVIEFRSGVSKAVGTTTHVKKTHRYALALKEPLRRHGPNGELMHVGFVPLSDLHVMFQEMGTRFFERNIRAALPEDGSVNRVITRAFQRIVLDQRDDPSVFAFHHNGVTLYAEALEQEGKGYKITEPRLLNGAQTVTTFARFLQKHGLEANKIAKELCVLARIVTDASSQFVTTVTINNNRQNPVEPWNLRANDEIQLALQDKLRKDIGVYYERQENAFVGLSDEDREELGVRESKAIQLRRLAELFLVVDGEVDKVGRMREVFEDEKIYTSVFNETRLQQDSKKLVLCYKVHFRLRRLLTEISERGPNKYDYIQRARTLLWALLCQAMLHDEKLAKMLTAFGSSLAVENEYATWLLSLASTKCRFLIRDVAEDPVYAQKVAEGNFTFLRTNAAYKRAMDAAMKRFGWAARKLK